MPCGFSELNVQSIRSLNIDGTKKMDKMYIFIHIRPFNLHRLFQDKE